MWWLGTITADALPGALGQWHVMPWGNPGSWHRGVMPGDSPVGWFFRNPNLWFEAQSAKWLKKRPLPEKNLSKLGNSRTFCLASSRGSSLQIRFWVISLFEGKWPNFYFIANIYENIIKINNWNWEVTHHYLIFLTLLEMGSLVLRLCIVVSD